MFFVIHIKKSSESTWVVMHKDYFKIIIFSLQDAFITLLPYFLIRALLTLLSVFNEYFHYFDSNNFIHNVHLLYDLFPLLLCLSISIHLGKGFKFKKNGFILLSLFAFLMLSEYISFDGNSMVLSPNVLMYSFSIPILLTLGITILKEYDYSFNILTSGHKEPLNEAFNFLFPYTAIVLIALSVNMDIYQRFVNYISNVFSSFAIEVQASLHLIISHLLWLFGIHGTTTYRYTFNMDFYKESIFAGLPYEQFFSAFIIFGGAGSTISLIIAILIASKDRHATLIAKSSIPFAIFNINEPIIYGLPIAFNKNYILPFLFVPIINFTLSYALLTLGVFSFHNVDVPWTTPALLSGYLLTDSLMGSAWQALLIILGVFIYLPFAKRQLTTHASREEFYEKLSLVEKLSSNSESYNSFLQYQNISMEAEIINAALKDINEGNLILFYQPQIELKSGQIYGFEALLRLIKDGKVYAPTFLSTIEKAGLEEVIDMWVVRQVKKDIVNWKKITKEIPHISINLYPKTLVNSKNIYNIIQELSTYNVSIEIVEKALSHNFEKINTNLAKLKQAGIYSAVDDFGSDQANLSLLGVINTESIKLDKSLLDHCDTTKGSILYQSSCKTLKNMNFHIIAEGVENAEQLNFMKKCKVDVIQGWYYSRALPLHKAIEYRVSS